MTNYKKRILILTSSGGGGHLQAAYAKKLDLSEKEYQYIIQKDVFLDFLGKPLGASFAGSWNFCQTHGRISSLYFFSICSRIVDVAVSPVLMMHMLYQLNKHDIDHVIDTQPNGTKVFLKSIRFISKMKKKSITYEKILTDMPTKGCIHYFKPFQKLKDKDKQHLKVVTTKPFLKEKETEEQFWKTTTGLSLNNIQYDDFPLRPAFKIYKDIQKPLSLEFNTYSPSHTHIICKCLSFGKTSFIRGKNNISMHFSDQTLSLITLGSFPQKSLLITYMKKFIAKKTQYCNSRKDILFILVGPQRTSMHYYQSIIKEIENTKNYPKNLTILPLAFQDDTALAPLYYNLDFIIAKSGGLTTMELIQSVKKNIYIHDNSEEKLSRLLKLITRNTVDSMPPWERGNANFILKKKRANMINPLNFDTITKDFFVKSANFAPVDAL